MSLGQQGPFVFEHAPAKLEGCTACHIPHGISNPKMLKRPSVRQLCFECHTGITEELSPQAPSLHNQAQVRYQNARYVTRLSMAPIRAIDSLDRSGGNMHTKTRRNLILSAGLSMIALLATVSVAQTPKPSPSPASDEGTPMEIILLNPVPSSVPAACPSTATEKFRSDLNYRAGARLFNSSFFIKDNNQRNEAI